jgi:hypothetical protein
VIANTAYHFVVTVEDTQRRRRVEEGPEEKRFGDDINSSFGLGRGRAKEGQLDRWFGSDTAPSGSKIAVRRSTLLGMRPLQMRQAELGWEEWIGCWVNASDRVRRANCFSEGRNHRMVAKEAESVVSTADAHIVRQGRETWCEASRCGKRD